MRFQDGWLGMMLAAGLVAVGCRVAEPVPTAQVFRPPPRHVDVVPESQPAMRVVSGRLGVPPAQAEPLITPLPPVADAPSAWGHAPPGSPPGDLLGPPQGSLAFRPPTESTLPQLPQADWALRVQQPVTSPFAGIPPAPAGRGNNWSFTDILGSMFGMGGGPAAPQMAQALPAAPGAPAVLPRDVRSAARPTLPAAGLAAMPGQVVAPPGTMPLAPAPATTPPAGPIGSAVPVPSLLSPGGSSPQPSWPANTAPPPRRRWLRPEGPKAFDPPRSIEIPPVPDPRNPFKMISRPGSDPQPLAAEPTAEDALRNIPATVGPGSPRWQTFGYSAENIPLEFLQLGRGPRRVLVLGPLGGDEPAAEALVERLSADLLTQPARLAQAEVMIVARPNPDGARRGTRGNARGVDLAHDYAALIWQLAAGQPAADMDPPQVETAALLRLIDWFAPQRVVLLRQSPDDRPRLLVDRGEEVARRLAGSLQLEAQPRPVQEQSGHLGTYLAARGVESLELMVPAANPRANWDRYQYGLWVAMSEFLIPPAPRRSSATLLPPRGAAVRAPVPPVAATARPMPATVAEEPAASNEVAEDPVASNEAAEDTVAGHDGAAADRPLVEVPRWAPPADLVPVPAPAGTQSGG